jgi:hypothetical protein
MMPRHFTTRLDMGSRFATLAATLLATLLFAGCSSSPDPEPADAGPDTVGPLPDGYGPLWPCDEPGRSCNPHDTCAIDAVCGPDKLCRPASRQNCDDGLACTQDVCKGMGLCDHVPLEGTCALPAKVGTKTEIQCFKKGDRRPDEPCLVCDPTVDGKTWTNANGGYCDDGEGCTKDDYCSNGTCKGTYYGTQCADAYGCTDDLCDGKGGCLPNKLRSDACLINGVCYKDKENDPSGACKTCDVTKSQSAWTPITNTCLIDGKCYKPGDKHPFGCAECDPTVNASAWTVKGNECLIDKECKKAGDKDSISCASCDPSKNKYAWTPLPGVCKIGGLCYQSGVAHPGACAVCDPVASATSWTVKGSDCLIDNVCKKPGDKDLINCSTCDPVASKYAWTPIPGLCKIAGACYTSGAPHPGGCAVCDPSTPTGMTSWTVKGSDCLIDNLCRKPGDKDSLGCSACDPLTNKYGWSPLPGLCKIDGACHAANAPHPGGCGSCNPASPNAWTVSGTGCLIDFACVASGATHPAACGSCDPAKSATSWSVSGTGCLIGNACYASGAKEAGGCGTCDPLKSTVAWSRPSGCLISHLWSKGIGGTSSDYGYGVAVDSNGNLYVTGYFYNSVDFGGGALTSAGSNDIFLASYSPSGKHRWSKRFGSTSSDYGYALAVDGSGNVYLAGYFYGSVDFGGGALTSAGSNDIVLASYTPSGAHRWSKRFGGTSSDYGYGVAVDSSGNVYLTGAFYSTIDFGGGTLTSAGSNDVFLASYTVDGQHRWSKAFGGTSTDYGYGVAVDSASNVYLTGYFYNTINFGGSALTSKGSCDVYLASFTSAGSHRWSKSFGGTSSDYGYSLATDSGGNLYLTGNFHTSIDFGGAPIAANGTSSDIFLASFSSGGVHRWSKGFGGTSNDYGYGVATDPAGNVFVTGSFYTSIDFGGGAQALNGTSLDTFLASFNSSGGYRWSRVHGSTSSETGRGVACDAAGNLLAVGSYGAAIDFGGGSIATAGSSDAYLLKLAP